MRALAGGLDAVADVAAEFTERRRDARLRRDLAHGRVDIAKAFSGLDEKYRADDGFDTIQERWDADAQAARSALLSGVQDQELRDQLAMDFEFEALRQRNRFSKDAFVRERDFSLGQFDADTEHYLTRYVNAPSDEAAEDARREFLDGLDLVSDFAGAAETAKRRESFEDSARFGRAMRIAEAGDYESVDLGQYDDLAPDQYEDLRAALDKRGKDEAVSAAVAGVEGLAYVEQLERLRGIEDDEVRADALSEVDRVHRVDERITTERRVQAYDAAWDRAVDTAAGTAQAPLSVQEIRAMDLDTGQKEHLMSLVTGKGAGGKDGGAKALELYAYNLARRIQQGDATVDDRFIWKEYLAGNLAKEGKNKLLSAWSEQKTVPELGRAKEMLLAEFPEASGGAEEFKLLDGTTVTTTPKARYLDSLNTWVKQFKEDKGRSPSYDETLEMGRKIMRPEVEGSWFFGMGEVEAPWRTGKTMRDYQAADIARADGLADPQAVGWDEENRVHYWVRDGWLWVQDADGVRMRKKMASQQEEK